MPQLPGDGEGGAEDNQAPSPPPGPEYRTEILHEHHTHWIWEFDPLLLALALLGLALAWPLSGMLRRPGRIAAGLTAAGFLALAAISFAAGIDPQSGPGAYSRRPVEIERIDGVPEVIVRHIHIDHFHPPVDLATHWLLFGAGLAVLALPALWGAAKRRPEPA